MSADTKVLSSTAPRRRTSKEVDTLSKFVVAGETHDRVVRTGSQAGKRSRRSVVCATLGAALFTLVLAGCGGSTDQQRLDQDKLDRARAEGARQARIDERTKQDRRETARLRRQIEQLRKHPSSPSGGGSSSSGGSSRPAPSTTKDCGAGISANSATSCPFAQNVRDTYVRDEAPSIEVYSPITQQTYTMSCSAGTRTVCRGGNNAVVEF